MRPFLPQGAAGCRQEHSLSREQQGHKPKNRQTRLRPASLASLVAGALKDGRCLLLLLLGVDPCPSAVHPQSTQETYSPEADSSPFGLPPFPGASGNGGIRPIWGSLKVAGDWRSDHVCASLHASVHVAGPRDSFTVQ